MQWLNLHCTALTVVWTCTWLVLDLDIKFYSRIGAIDVIRILQSRFVKVGVSHWRLVGSFWGMRHDVYVTVHVDSVCLAPIRQFVKVDTFLVDGPVSLVALFGTSSRSKELTCQEMDDHLIPPSSW